MNLQNAISVIIGADSSSLRRDLAKTDGEMKSWAQKAKASLTPEGIRSKILNPANLAMGISAAFAAAVVTTFKNAYNYANKMSDAARDAHTSVEAVTSLRFSARKLDIDPEAAISAMSALYTPTKKAEEALNAVGIATRNADGTLIDTASRLRQLAAAVKDAGGETEGLRLASSVLGPELAGKLYPLLSQGSEGFDKLAAAAKAAGAVLSSGDAAQFKTFSNMIGQAFENINVNAGHFMVAMAKSKNLLEAFLKLAASMDGDKDVGLAGNRNGNKGKNFGQMVDEATDYAAVDISTLPKMSDEERKELIVRLAAERKKMQNDPLRKQSIESGLPALGDNSFLFTEAHPYAPKPPRANVPKIKKKNEDLWTDEELKQMESDRVAKAEASVAKQKENADKKAAAEEASKPANIKRAAQRKKIREQLEEMNADNDANFEANMRLMKPAELEKNFADSIHRHIERPWKDDNDPDSGDGPNMKIALKYQAELQRRQMLQSQWREEDEKLQWTEKQRLMERSFTLEDRHIESVEASWKAIAELQNGKKDLATKGFMTRHLPGVEQAKMQVQWKREDNREMQRRQFEIDQRNYERERQQSTPKIWENHVANIAKMIGEGALNSNTP